MNPVMVMMMVIGICLREILGASCNSGRPTKPPKPLIVHRFCRTRDLVAAYIRVCPRSLEEETVVRGFDDAGLFRLEEAPQLDTTGN